MRLRNLLPLLALALAPACTNSEDHETAIVVYVQSDLVVPTDIDRVRIKTTSATSRAPLHEYTFMLGAGEQRVTLPVREGLYPTIDSQAAIRVEAQGLLGEVLVVARAAVLSFVPGRQVVLDLSLLASCKDRACSAGLTCGPNGCQPETVDGNALPIYKPGKTPESSTKLDASISNANSDGAMEAGSPGDVVQDVPASGADASRDSALDSPESTGATTVTSTASETGTGTTETGTDTGQTTGTSAATVTFTAATGTGTSLATGTGSGVTATNTGSTTAIITSSGATATNTAGTATQTSVATAPTATTTGTGTGTSTGSGTGTATKTATMTTIGTTLVTGVVTGTAIATATLNVTVPSTATAIITQTITDTATATGTASMTYTLTATSTAASTSTATSSASALAMTYLLLTKDDSLPAATDTSTSTQTAQGTAIDQTSNYFCGTGIYEKLTACNAYMYSVAAGQANLFSPSSTRYQPSTNSNSRIYDLTWRPTPGGKLSISVWVKPSQITGSKQSILAWNFGDVQLFIDASGNAACFPVGTTPANTIALPLNQWSHLACTQNSTYWTLYVNGSGNKVTNTGPSTFHNPQPTSGVVNCLGYWYMSGWDLTSLTDPCGAGNQTAARFAGDLSLLRVYHDYMLNAVEVDNLRLCNNTVCTSTILRTGTATASTTATATITVTTTATATTAGTVPATSSLTATGTVSTIVTNIGSTTATFVQTGTQTQMAHRFGW